MTTPVSLLISLAFGLIVAAPATGGILVLPAPPAVTGPGVQMPGAEGLLLPVQSYEDDDGWTDSKDGSRTSRIGESLNRAFTKDIVTIIRHANATCDDERVQVAYRIDCLRVYYGWAADIIPDRGEYYDIKKALRSAEKKLAAIVSANLDRSAPVIMPREGHKKNAPKLPPLRAVKPAAEKKAIRQAEAVIKETELVILRSGEDPSRREVHFDAVAEAVDSNLVILRSA